MGNTNHGQTLHKFLRKLEEMATAKHEELLSSGMLNIIAAIKYLHRNLQQDSINYENELLQLSVRYKKDFKQLLHDILQDVWIKERLRKSTAKLGDETLKRQLLEQIDSASTNFLFVTATLGTRDELDESEQEYAKEVFILNY